MFECWSLLGHNCVDILLSVQLINHVWSSQPCYIWWWVPWCWCDCLLVCLFCVAFDLQVSCKHCSCPRHKYGNMYGWWAWLPSIMALVALKKNRITIMQQYILGTITFGLLPVFYALYDLADDMVDYLETREGYKKFHGFPLVVLWNMFLALALQIHVFGLYFAWQLIKCWRSMVTRKKVKWT